MRRLLLMGAVVLGAVVPAAPVPAPAPSWPVVYRVIQPEDLDRC